jgi:RNA polymerase sigma-70 factor (ECF subfamily)
MPATGKKMAMDATEDDRCGAGTSPDCPARIDLASGGDYAALAALVARIRAGEEQALAELYAIFSKGIRFQLCRQLGPQELDDKVHDTFLIVVEAIRRGNLREPERLMGFVHTIVRRQIAACIESAVNRRRNQADLEAADPVADERSSPEAQAIARQKIELMKRVLREISRRDREILTRFYIYEQSQEQICREMNLTETQFRLLKSRAKARFGELGKKRLEGRPLARFLLRASSGRRD